MSLLDPTKIKEEWEKRWRWDEDLWWQGIAQHIKDPPRDYWDFPTTMLAFAKSLKNSKLWEMGDAFFRVRGKQATLINWFCTPWDLGVIIDLMKKDYPKIKSLNWGSKMLAQETPSRYPAGPTLGQKISEFKVDGPYDFTEAIRIHSRKTQSNLKRKYERGKENYRIFIDVPLRRKEIQDLFVVKGHYQAYIDLLLRGFAHSFTFWKGEELRAICGYEIWKGKAQITLMKNKPGENYFPVFFWAEVVSRLSSRWGVDEVYCGATAESLKRLLGFVEYDTWKLKL